MTANAGYHQYNTGDVLTAAQVQFNLQNQSVMYFASSAARTTAIGSVTVEGMVSYIPANGLEYYNGSAWVTLSTGGDITGVAAGKGLTGGGTTGDVTLSLGTTAKGDLVAGTGTTTAAALTVGSDGSTLVADSSTSTGLRYQGNYAAGKQKFLNADFKIWQRGTSFTGFSSGQFFADRFSCNFNGSGATRTVSQQTFTPATAPVAGYEGQYFLRYAQSVAGTGGGYNQLKTWIEDVRSVIPSTTYTLSFWAKAAAAKNVDVILGQSFGSGGSADVETTIQSAQALTTSWVRYSYTFTVPSISGKTIGTGSYAFVYLGLPNNDTFTIDTWGWQLEQANTATAFQTATGTVQGELAACQRYLQLLTTPHPMKATSTSTVFGTVNYQTMRSTPSLSLLSSNPFIITDPTLSSKTQSAAQITLQGSANDGFLFSMGNFSTLTTGNLYYSNMSNSVAILANAEL